VNRRVVVTGLGVVSPHGSDPATMFARLMSGESVVREVRFESPEPYTNVAAVVEDFDPSAHLGAQLRSENIDRVTQLSLAAAAAAMTDADVEVGDDLRHRTGVSFGTGMGSSAAIEETHVQALTRDPTRVRPLTVLKVMNNASAGHIAARFGLGGPDLTYSCACSSSAVAIGEAYRQIRHGYADVMIAGGAEAPSMGDPPQFTLDRSRSREQTAVEFIEAVAGRKEHESAGYAHGNADRAAIELD